MIYDSKIQNLVDTIKKNTTYFAVSWTLKWLLTQFVFNKNVFTSSSACCISLFLLGYNGFFYKIRLPRPIYEYQSLTIILS